MKFLLAALGLFVLASSAQAQSVCINDHRGRRCYDENITVPYSPRTYYRHYDRGGYHVERYYYDAPRYYYPAPRRRHSDKDFLLGLGIGIGTGIILNEIGR